MIMHPKYEGMDLPTLKLLFARTKALLDKATNGSGSTLEANAIYKELKEIQYQMSIKEIEGLHGSEN